MTTDAIAEIRELRQELKTIAVLLSPWIGQEEMQARYQVTGKTLLAMERRGQIPRRVNGRWVRAEVVSWEGAEIDTQRSGQI